MKKLSIEDKDDLTEEEFLKQYNSEVYEKPSVTVDMLIFTVVDKENENYRKLSEKALKILLVKRGDYPYRGKWALPGGFVAIDESLDEAVSRVLKKETNIEDIYVEQLYTWGEVNRDSRTRVISSSYMALVDSTLLSIKPGLDEEDARWFDVSYNFIKEKKVRSEKGNTYEKLVDIILCDGNEKLSCRMKITEELDGKVTREIIDTVGIAFDHGKFIEYAINRLRNKIEYTGLVFNLMPELFTLTELKQVYEIILGKELLAAAFRRKIANMVIETDQFTKDAGHRPSKLFRYNYEWKRKEV